MVHDDGPVGLDQVRVVFDDERVVSDAGVALVATLAQRLGLEGLVDRFVLLRPERPGARNAGRKVMSLVFAMALGAGSIDDCDVLRSGRTRRLLGGWVAAPSTLGTFLRAFTLGHVRQLDRVLGETLTRAWRAGAGPGGERPLVDVDSFVGELHGYQKQGASFGYTTQRGYHQILAKIPEQDWTKVDDYPDSGEAQIAETVLGGRRLIVRRVRTLGVREELFPAWQHYPFATNRDEQIALVEAEHRQHAVVELVIRDLKDQALEHFPSGQFNANAAWTVIACLAHNLLRWTGLLGLPNSTIHAARTLRRRLLALPGRLTSPAGHWTPHLPARWPWPD